MTNRTLGYAAQPLFPESPAIDVTLRHAGRSFRCSSTTRRIPCTQGSQAASLNQNGVVFFPGSTPLYLGGKLVGGLGVSGDGGGSRRLCCEAGGAAGFAAPGERARRTRW